VSWADRTRDAGRSLKEIELKDIQEQLDTVRDYLSDLAASASRIANRQWRGMRGGPLATAQEAEELMKENFAVSLVAALGIGILVGFLIRHGTTQDSLQARGTRGTPFGLELP
jgi:hypothetical protein